MIPRSVYFWSSSQNKINWDQINSVEILLNIRWLIRDICLRWMFVPTCVPTVILVTDWPHIFVYLLNICEIICLIRAWTIYICHIYYTYAHIHTHLFSQFALSEFLSIFFVLESRYLAIFGQRTRPNEGLTFLRKKSQLSPTTCLEHASYKKLWTTDNGHTVVWPTTDTQNPQFVFFMLQNV